MTLSFSFDNPLTPEVLAAVNELYRLTRGGDVRRAVAPPAPTENTVAPPAPEQPAQSGPTEADVRAAIARAKERVWGMGHETNPALTKEAKAPLVEAFKEIARRWGADRPSLLPTPEARGRFIQECDVLQPAGDGTAIEGDLPF